MVHLALDDFQIPVHKVWDTLPNTVTDWKLNRLENQKQTFTISMRLRITQDQKKLRVSMDKVPADGTAQADLVSFLGMFFRASNDRKV